MSLRARLTWITAAAVTAALALGSVSTYLLVRASVFGDIDGQLRTVGMSLANAPQIGAAFAPPGVGTPPETVTVNGSAGTEVFTVVPGGIRSTSGLVLQTIAPTGAPVGTSNLPVETLDVAIANTGGVSSAATETVNGERFRVVTAGSTLGAVKIAQRLAPTDRTLGRLQTALFFVTLGGGLAAAVGGRLLARAQVAPVARLTDLARRVTRTGDPSARIARPGGGELGALADSFNEMLGALERSLVAQRRLVADVSHELRTPLTSLRTNIEVLERVSDLPADERKRLRSDVLRGIDELGALIGDITEAGRDSESRSAVIEVRLDEVVAAEVAAARAAHAGREIRLDVEPTLVRGAPDRLARAVRNLVSNGLKFGPPGAPVEVTLRGGVLRVRDHGPGVDDADLPHVFGRFYRAPAARTLPGSGLGLAIVRDIAEAHGARVSLASAPGGGCVAELTGLPLV